MNTYGYSWMEQLVLLLIGIGAAVLIVVGTWAFVNNYRVGVDAQLIIRIVNTVQEGLE